MTGHNSSPLASLNVDFDILLKSVVVDDASEIYHMVSDNRDFLAATLDWPAHYSYTSAVEECARAVKDAQNGVEAPYKVMYRGRFAGIARFHSRQESTAQMGYWIDGKHQGKRIISRATQGLRDYGFSQWGLEEIKMHIKPNNEASRRVAKSLGACIVGMTENDLSGRMTKYEVWSLDKAAWERDDQ